MEFHIGNARHAEQHSADSEQRNLMSTTIKTTIQEDREIINAIILHIVSTERRENKFARAVNAITDGRVSEEQFRNWIAHFDADLIRLK